MKTIGIKLADGSFYPVLEEGTPKQKNLELTTAHNNQTKVMVDLYRSANCSMDDAEYVDSLQIESLNAHPTGEANISFTVALDKDNQLSANIIDEETGKESNTTITLVSRTLEERLVTDEYKLSDYGMEPKKKGGLLAAASRLREANKTENNIVESAENEEPEIEETSVEEPVFDDFNLGDPDANTEKETESNISDEPEAAVEQTETPVEAEIPADDFTFEEPAETTSEDFSFDIPDETEVPATEETPVESENPVENNISEEDNFTTDDLPDFNLDNLEPTAEPAETTTEDTTEATESNTTDDLSDFNFDDFDTNTSAENSEVSSTEPTIDSSDITEENSDLPDFNFDDFDTTTENTETTASASDDLNFSTDDNFEIPDFGDTDTSNDNTPVGGGISFTGLYDKETELGESSNYEQEDSSKKTRVPVIICVICAFICVIATLLILFIIPSKYNLISKKTEKEQTTEIVQNEPEPEPVVEETQEPEIEPEPEPIPEAKENEIVIVEQAEEVVPEQPPVVEEKPKNITYKIRWGDTLWDISDTYYKNPWRYKYIARFNNIKDPDYIISGTIIEIPAE